MSDRENLYKLLQEATIANAHYPPGQFAVFVVDHLIKNGVVIQKQGEWIFGRNHGDFVEATCTSCDGMLLVKWYDKIDIYRRCPNCGAMMRGVKLCKNCF